MLDPVSQKKVDEFVENLLTKGVDVPCDDTDKSFRNSTDIPPLYDEALFERGQKFYRENCFSHTTAAFMGLMSVLTIPSILKILMHTGMSRNEETAYRRYAATLYHVLTWYKCEFKPGSKLWKSVSDVRKMHNSTSNKCPANGLHRINQRDMVLTQFGLVGLLLCRRKWFGLAHATNEEWQSFIYLWRVLGYALGIADRFNICNGTVAETEEICNQLIDKVFLPEARKKDPDSLKMMKYSINGLWCIFPMGNFNVSLTSYYMMLENDAKDVKQRLKKLTMFETVNIYFMLFIIYCLRFEILRAFWNYYRTFEIWLGQTFPVMAYIKYGFEKGRVRI